MSESVREGVRDGGRNGGRERDEAKEGVGEVDRKRDIMVLRVFLPPTR